MLDYFLGTMQSFMKYLVNEQMDSSFVVSLLRFPVQLNWVYVLIFLMILNFVLPDPGFLQA